MLMEIIKAACKFWQSAENTSESTITARPAKMRVKNKPQTQVGLGFSDVVNINIQRNREFYQDQWKIMSLTAKELYVKYLKANPGKYVSWAALIVRQPVYIGSTCYCKNAFARQMVSKRFMQCCNKNKLLVVT